LGENFVRVEGFRPHREVKIVSAVVLRNGRQHVQTRPRLTAEVVFNALVSKNRQLLAPRSWAPGLDPPERDLDRECGYPTNPDIGYYKLLYDRVGVAGRTVNIWPDECLAGHPDLAENLKKRKTSFERRAEEVIDQTLLWHYVQRADRLSGIGQYGVLLLGLDDGRDLSETAEGFRPNGTPDPNFEGQRDLLFLRAFDQSLVRVGGWETDPASPRYGMPTNYLVNFASPEVVSSVTTSGVPYNEQEVHWTRAVHLADCRQSSEVIGYSRMHAVLNDILNVRKVGGASAEMFWKGGFPGYQFKTNPDLAIDLDENALAEEVDAYVNGLKRYMTAVSGEWASLAPQVADPSKTLLQHFTLLCAGIQVPLRVFLGTESGHLASTQDAIAWKGRVGNRRLNYVEPMVVRPLVDRLQALGVLPRVKKYILTWPDLLAMSDKDRMDVALKQVQALFQYVQGRVNQVMPHRILLTQVLGYSEAMADAVEAELAAGGGPKIEPANTAGAQSGGRLGNPSADDTGRPPGGPPEGM
jgi:uncharacterized protein